MLFFLYRICLTIFIKVSTTARRTVTLTSFAWWDRLSTFFQGNRVDDTNDLWTHFNPASMISHSRGVYQVMGSLAISGSDITCWEIQPLRFCHPIDLHPCWRPMPYEHHRWPVVMRPSRVQFGNLCFYEAFKFFDPVTLVRSPTLTKWFRSWISVALTTELSHYPLRLDGAGFDRLHFFDHFLDVIGCCTTAAAYDIYHSIEGKSSIQVSHFVRILVIFPIHWAIRHWDIRR